MKRKRETPGANLSSLADLIQFLSRCRNIIVVAGAGISVSCGIPDFRSKTTGIYDSLNCHEIELPSPELLFDMDYFNLDPVPFYRYLPKLLPCESTRPSSCHRFIAALEQRRQLRRMYTQNIDGLERKAGITKLIECHGTLQEFRCTSCRKKSRLDSSLMAKLLSRTVLYCEKCSGVMKPGIIFFGESVPASVHSLMEKDLKVSCDLVITTGTSLKVGGTVKEMLGKFGPNTKKLLINKELLHEKVLRECGPFDLTLLGSCDDVVECLAEHLNWSLSWGDSGSGCESEPTTTPRSAGDRWSCEKCGSDNVYSIRRNRS